MRKDALVNGSYYHVYSRSIAGYIISNDSEECSRFVDICKVYRYADFNYRFSRFKELGPHYQQTVIENLKEKSPVLVEIVSYCIMPTHVHFLLKQTQDQGISKYISKILNSYSRFFNTKHKRTGPLWSGRFKSVLVSSDEQLLHLTRYIHLNPTSAGLVDQPDEWQFSSYNEYIDPYANEDRICSTESLFDITPKEYRKFVLDGKAYQRDLSKIKKLLLDNYTG